ncbi:TonB-dependent receptor [Aliikangiella sp. G2MR2-5]|uniref:TonB-dependent receptor n=1 Tax=Aliikangiella sp. G2MR2-5 TaxID=2788943 RepID=UPI0018A90CB0|nr:TonB-dependent receptor [Aliikangiella sp. G2MR2-5]
MKLKTKILAGFALSLCSAAVMAADTGGELRGHVESASGKDVANAAITVIHKTKGITRTIRTNSLGNYTLRNLPAGEYQLMIERDGFEAEAESFKVLIGKPVIMETVLGEENRGQVLQIVGTRMQKLDMAETTAGRAFDFEEIKIMPVEAGLESMVLMTPGTVENAAPGAFNGASSIGGASSAENGYYLNGINITQIESGLGSFRMPWEAIQQTNVQTSGITAEFGGALGGIVNTVSKSGDNEFKFGAQYRIDPEFGYKPHNSVRLMSDPELYQLNNERDELEFSEYNIWASGPIVEDKAFFYFLYNPQTTNSEGAGNSSWYSTETKSDRWFLNVDWHMFEGHSVGVTAFNTKREFTTLNHSYDVASDTIAPESNGISFAEDGGMFKGITYHGEFNDVFSLDMVWGQTEEEEVPVPANFYPSVLDCSTGTCTDIPGYSYSNSSIEPQKFTRDQFRVDFRFDLDRHSIAFGIDQYDIDVYVNNRQNGVAVGDLNDLDDSAATGWWAYGIAGDAYGSVGTAAVEAGLAEGTEFVRRRIRNRFSDSTVSSKAFYAQDSWKFNDEWTFNYGVRVVDFANTVSSGEKYVDTSGNIAPRLAAIWDIDGKGEDKLFMSLGRYFQPVAARMNIVQGSSSVEYFDYYENLTPGEVPARLEDGSPARGDRLLPRDYRQRGITDPNLIASKNLKAMYSDQLSIGYSTQLNEYTASVTATYNELGRSVEDTDYMPVLSTKLEELGIDNNTGQGSFYILANPGDEVQIAYDFDGDGTVDNVTLTPDELQLAKPVRKYIAWDFQINGPVTDDFEIFASYTWSHSYGNTEGLVKTTNGQADPGWTSDYDYGDALDHAYGDLPNDRRHSVKVSGVYDLSDSMALSFVYRGASGRPLNTLTPHPEGVDSCAPDSPWSDCVSRWYIGGFYDAEGNPSPRGSAGNLDWTHNVDLSFSYRNDEILEGLLLKATVYNLFAADTAVDVNEWTNSGNYGLTEIYQQERYLSLIARVEF